MWFKTGKKIRLRIKLTILHMRPGLEAHGEFSKLCFKYCETNYFLFCINFNSITYSCGTAYISSFTDMEKESMWDIRNKRKKTDLKSALSKIRFAVDLNVS